MREEEEEEVREMGESWSICPYTAERLTEKVESVAGKVRSVDVMSTSRKQTETAGMAMTNAPYEKKARS